MNTTSIWIGLRCIKKLHLQYQGHLLIIHVFVTVVVAIGDAPATAF